MSAEASLSALKRFDAIISDTIDLFSLCLEFARSPNGSLLQCEFFDAEVVDRSHIESCKIGKIPQDILRRMKQLLHVAASIH